MPDASQLTPLLLIVPIFAAGMSIWTWALARLAQRQPVLPYEARTNVPWSGLDVLALVLLTLLLQAFAAGQIARLSGVDVHAAEVDVSALQVPSILGSAIGNSLAVIAILLWLAKARGATTSDLGFCGPIGSDLVLGCAGFSAAAVIIYPLMLLLTQWIEYQHPILKAVEQDHGVGVLWISTVAAVIVAPIAEELVFRVLFQGWLEKLRRFWREAQRDLPLVNRHTGPIVVSAALFGVAHYSNGPAPIPLFILGLFLGYLYHQTHRLLPCVVLHICVNALTTAQLWLQHFYPSPP
jgi:membrane protease YdiL (CAAX protease family)